MVDALGTPTVFSPTVLFQWPGLGNLICYQGGGQKETVVENPANADWFFSTTLKNLFNCFMQTSLGPPITSTALSGSTKAAYMFMEWLG